MVTWKFGEGQTNREEHAEIVAAKAAGREREYLEQQRWHRLRNAERDRKRRGANGR